MWRFERGRRCFQETREDKKTVDMKKWVAKFQVKWGVGLWGFTAIMIAFSLAGMTVVRVKTPILHAILPDGAPKWLFIGTYLLLIFPLYQIFLVVYGALLGQFRFFWEKEKKLVRWIYRRVSRTN